MGDDNPALADVPAQRLRSFDYATIADVIVHVRYAARQGGELLGQAATSALKDAMSELITPGAALLLSLPHDLPSKWSRFAARAATLGVSLTKGLFPYVVQDRAVTTGALELYSTSGAHAARGSFNERSPPRRRIERRANHPVARFGCERPEAGCDDVLLVVRHTFED